MRKGERDALNRALRLLKIAWLLESGEKVTRRHLADACGVDVRTISRDMPLVESLGIACRWDRTSGSYVREGPQRVAPIRFSPSELAALALAEDAVTARHGTPLGEAVLSAFRKIREMLPPAVMEYLAEVRNAIAFRGWAERDYRAAREAFEVVKEAALTRRRLVLRYYTISRDSREERAVDPYRFYEDRGRWFLAGYCHMRQDIRIFALENIEAARMTGETFSVPEEFTLEGYLQNSLSHLRGEEAEVAIRFAPEAARWVRARRWAMDHELSAGEDGSVLLRARCAGLDGIFNEVRSWGSLAEVLEPPELRQRMAGEARRTLALYEKSPVGVQKE